jgi:polyisoprenoid-binding protein YceI
VTRYPEIAFASTSVRSQGTDGASVRIVVAGTLTLRGRSFPVEVPLEVSREGGAIEVRGRVDLNLRDLGIEPPSVAGVVKVANRFRLEFDVRASAAAP